MQFHDYPIQEASHAPIINRHCRNVNEQSQLSCNRETIYTKIWDQ